MLHNVDQTEQLTLDYKLACEIGQARSNGQHSKANELSQQRVGVALLMAIEEVDQIPMHRTQRPQQTPWCSNSEHKPRQFS